MTVRRTNVGDDGLDLRLRRRLGDWRRRWRVQRCVSGAVWGVAIFLTLVFLAVVPGRLLFDSSPGLRWFLFGLTWFPTVLFLLVAVIWPLLRPLAIRRIVRDVERRCPETRGLLLSAVELAALEEEARRDSLDMREEVQRRAGESSDSVVSASIYPLAESAARRALLPLALVIVAHLMAALAPGLGYFRGLQEVLAPSTVLADVLPARSDDSEPETGAQPVSEPPTVVSFKKTVTFPPYLSRDVEVAQESHGHLRYLQGSRVDLEIETTQSLSAASLELETEGGERGELTLEVQGNGAVLRGMAIEGRARYRVVLTAAETGVVNRWSPLFEISAEIDIPPALTVVGPEDGSLVSSRAIFRVSIEADDEHGLAGLRRRIEFGRGNVNIVTEELPLADDARRFVGGDDVDLRPLGLSTGDRVTWSYEARDLGGNTTLTEARTLQVYEEDALLARSELVKYYRQAVASIRSLNRDVRNIGTIWKSRSRSVQETNLARLHERALAWIANAERGLETLEAAISEGMAQNTEQIRGVADSQLLADLESLHDDLKRALEVHARPGANLLAEVTRDQRWKGIVASEDLYRVAFDTWGPLRLHLDRLARESVSLLLDFEVVAQLSESLLLLSARVEAFGESRDLAISSDEGLSLELETHLTSILGFPLDLLDARRDQELLAHLRTEAERLLESLESTRRRGESFDWRILGLDLQQTLKSMERYRRVFDLVSLVRDRRLERHSRDSAQIADLAEHLRDADALWRKFALDAYTELDEKPSKGPEVFRAFLARLVAGQDSKIRGADEQARLEALTRQLEWSYAVIAARGAESSRYVYDLSLVLRVLEVAMESARRDARVELLSSVKSNDRAQALVALSRLSSSLDTTGDFVTNAERLRFVGRNLAILELSRSLGTVRFLAAELRRFEDMSDPLHQSFLEKGAQRFRYFRAAMRTLVEESPGRQAEDFGEAVGRILQSIEMHVLERGYAVRAQGKRESSERELRFLQSLARVEERIERLVAEETTSIHAARGALLSLLPDMTSKVGELLDRTREAHEDTEALEESMEEAESEEVENELSRLHDLEREIESDLEQLREDLASEAASLDLADSEQLQRAQDLDAAALALEDQEPKISDMLLAAVAREDSREEALKRILPRQQERTETLSRLQRHFSSAQKGKSGELAGDLGVEDKLSRLYREVEEFRELRDRQLELVKETELRESAELERLSKDQRQLEKRLSEVLKRSPDGQKALRDLHVDSLETLQQEVKSHVAVQSDINRERQQKALEMRAELNRLRSELEGLERESADLRSEKIEQLTRRFPQGSVSESRSLEDAGNRLRESEGYTREARELLEDEPEKAFSLLRKSVEKLHAAQQEFQQTRERVDPIAAEKESKEPHSKVQNLRARALSLVDRVRSGERRFSHDRQRREQMRAIEDFETGEQRDRLNRELTQTSRAVQLEKDAREKRVLKARRHRITQEFKQLEAHIEAVNDQRRKEDASAASARERLIGDVHGSSRELRDLHSELADGNAETARAFVEASEELTRAGQRLERNGATRARDELDRALRSLGANRGDVGELVDSLSETHDTVAELRKASRKIRDRLGRLSEREVTDRGTFDRRERVLRRNVEQSRDRLDRLIRTAADVPPPEEGEEKGEPRLEVAKRVLGVQVLVEIDRLLDVLKNDEKRLYEAGSPHLELSDDDPGVRAVKALGRTGNLLQGELAGGSTGSSEPSGDDAGTPREGTPGKESAPQLGDALEKMSQAGDELERRRTRRASMHQRSAAEALDRAIRAAAGSLSRSRSSSSPPGQSEAFSGQSSQQVDLASDASGEGVDKSSDARFDRELLEAIFGEGSPESRRWYLLPADLKREILQGRRENIPPRYLERVEAYYRRIAESHE